MSDTKTLAQFVREHTTGKTLYLPQWASFALFASRVVVSPLFLMPYFVALVVWPVLTGDKSVLHWILFAAFFAAGWLTFATVFSSNEMRSDGVLDDYMTILASNTTLGRWLVAHFGQRCD